MTTPTQTTPATPDAPAVTRATALAELADCRYTFDRTTTRLLARVAELEAVMAEIADAARCQHLDGLCRLAWIQQLAEGNAQ